MQAYVNREAERLAGESVGFSFGENWRKYLQKATKQQLAQAVDSLRGIAGLDDFNGKRFIDVGCGSGLFSLAALHLGAQIVSSVDVDPNSVACANALRDRWQGTSSWDVRRGSVLDVRFVESLGQADIVYSWGVLHHTGQMWRAIANALKLVAPGGCLCLALYNHPNNEATHMRLKRLYNRLPRPARPLLETAYAAARLKTVVLEQHNNPVSYIRKYGDQSRGMTFWRDVEDWLGGLPCEFASADEIREFAGPRGFALEHVFVAPPGANNEYRLRRPA